MSLASATYVEPPRLRTQWLVAILGLAMLLGAGLVAGLYWVTLLIAGHP